MTAPYSGGSGTTQDYCYNATNQLVSESSTTGGTNSSSFSYDDEGNTTTFGDITFSWDASDQNIGISQSGEPDITYTYDAVDRVQSRTDGSTTTTYAYCGYDDSACATVDPSSGDTIDAFISLPGGVLLTAKSDASDNIWSYPNIVGDMIATANESGSLASGPVTYDPWGQQNSGSTIHNAADGANFDAFGTGGKLEDSGAATSSTPVIQMGARIYVPAVGRFLSSDPIEGGCANPYVFGFGDPVNHPDLNGQGGYCHMISAETALDVGEALEAGGDVADALEDLGIGGPVGTLVAAILGYVLQGEGAMFVAAANLALASAAAVGHPARTAQVAVLIPTIIGIPDGVVPVPLLWGNSRYTPPQNANPQSLCSLFPGYTQI